jgi:hypothetical protein
MVLVFGFEPMKKMHLSPYLNLQGINDSINQLVSK